MDDSLRRALSAARIGTWSLDRSTDTFSLDPLLCESLGLDPKRDSIGREELGALMHPDDREAAWEALRGGPGGPRAEGAFEWELRVFRPDGEMRWLRATEVLGRAGPDQAGRVTGIAQDITVWKRAEQRLRVDAAVSRILASADSVASCASGVLRIIGTELGIEYCGLWLPEPGDPMLRCADVYAIEGAERRFGRFLSQTRTARVRRGEGLVGAVWESGRSVWLPSVSEDRAFRRIRAAMAEGLVSFVAFPLQAGSSFLGVIDMFSVRPLPPDPLLLDTLSGLGSEFAQYLLRDRVEQALRESEERFRGTFENAAVGVGHVDLEGRWLRVNARLCEITGYAREGLLSRTFQDITHPEDLEADLALVRRLLAGEIPTYSMEKRYLRPDGQAVWVQLTVSLIRRADGAPDYFIAVVEDIEDRKEAEARLRTALAVKDEFLGLVSHELRTPMTIILGMSAVIARGELDGQRAREMASDIADSAEVLNELIESMLLLARLEHEEEQPREPMLLGRTVGAVLERQRRRDPSRAYDLESRTSDTLVDAQPTWLERVIVNLVSNAAKYSHPGGDVRVVIEGGDGEVVLRVIDEGPGLAEADLAQVFEPFYRAPGAERRAPGTGLGLAISKRIIESLGGRIWARSDASGGSDFGFAIPLIASDDP